MLVLKTLDVIPSRPIILFHINLPSRRLTETQLDLELSAYYESAIKKLQPILDTYKTDKIHLICIGIGHFSECSISRHQLAFILLLKQRLKIPQIEFHEPILTATEVDILSQLNCSVARENCEGKLPINGPTIVYAPHCPKQLINNLLWRNFNPKALPHLIYIGNSFSNLVNSTPDRFLAIDAAFIVQLQAIYVETALVNNFKFSDIFNDTSIHQFNAVDGLSSEFWATANKEPVYTSENLELITADLIKSLKI